MSAAERTGAPVRLGCRVVEFVAPGGLAPRRDPNEALLAAIYRAIDTHPALDAAFRRQIHDERVKSFTLSPLAVVSEDGTAVPVETLGGAPRGARLQVRWAVLDGAAAGAMERVLARALGGFSLELERQELVVTRVSDPAPPLACSTTYAALFAQAQPASEIALALTSPFAVRSGHSVVAPADLAPRHFFGAWRDRWLAFSPAELAAVPAADLLGAIRLVPPPDLRLAPRRLLQSKAPARAFTGVVRFQIAGDDAIRQHAAALADYARYCGTGSGTAWGMGQTERL